MKVLWNCCEVIEDLASKICNYYLYLSHKYIREISPQDTIYMSGENAVLVIFVLVGHLISQTFSQTFLLTDTHFKMSFSRYSLSTVKLFGLPKGVRQIRQHSRICPPRVCCVWLNFKCCFFFFGLLARFRQCLLGVNDTISSMVGYSFFNILRVPCFELKPQRRCTEMYWWGM